MEQEPNSKRRRLSQRMMGFAFSILAKYGNGLVLPPYEENPYTKPIKSTYWPQNYPIEPYPPAVNNKPPYDYNQPRATFKDKNGEPLLTVQDNFDLAYMYLDEKLIVQDLDDFFWQQLPSPPVE